MDKMVIFLKHAFLWPIIRVFSKKSDNFQNWEKISQYDIEHIEKGIFPKKHFKQNWRVEIISVVGGCFLEYLSETFLWCCPFYMPKICQKSFHQKRWTDGYLKQYILQASMKFLTMSDRTKECLNHFFCRKR